MGRECRRRVSQDSRAHCEQVRDGMVGVWDRSMLGGAITVTDQNTKARMPALDVKNLLDACCRTLDPRQNPDPQHSPNRRYPEDQPRLCTRSGRPDPRDDCRG